MLFKCEIISAQLPQKPQGIHLKMDFPIRLIIRALTDRNLRGYMKPNKRKCMDSLRLAEEADRPDLLFSILFTHVNSRSLTQVKSHC